MQSGYVRLGVVVVLAAFIACGGSAGPSSPSSVPLPQVNFNGGEMIFADDFESGTLDAWQDGVNPSKQRVVTGADAQSGSHYLAVTYPAGGDGGWLTRFFMPGYETMYVSFYVRFPRDWSGGTKLVGMYGSRTDNQWSGFGKAGLCPDGTDFFDAMLVTDLPAPVRFYTYYPDMAREPGGGEVCWGRFGDQPGQAKYASPPPISTEVWHHIEFYVALNTPGNSDGQQRFWVDGVQGALWPQLRLRTSDVLRLNAVQMSFSTTSPKTQQLFVDSIEVRTGQR